MSDNVAAGLPNIGHTYHGGTPTSVGRSTELEGTVGKFAHNETATGEPSRRVSGQFRHAVLVRNTSGISLTPGRMVSWETGFRKRRVDGYTTTTGAEAAGVVDPDLPAAGVADDDLFWLFIKGPVLVKTPLTGDGDNVVAEGDVLGALTAATSGATTAGRPISVATATTATLPSVTMNNIGRAMSAKTTANTNADMLVDLNIL